MTATQRETVIPKNLQPRPSSFWPPMIGIRKWAATTPHNLQVTKQYAAKQKWHASFFGSKMESLNRKKRINVQWKVLASKMLDMMVWLSKHFLGPGVSDWWNVTITFTPALAMNVWRLAFITSRNWQKLRCLFNSDFQQLLAGFFRSAACWMCFFFIIGSWKNPNENPSHKR